MLNKRGKKPNTTTDVFHGREKHNVLTASHSYSNLKITAFTLHIIPGGF